MAENDSKKRAIAMFNRARQIEKAKSLKSNIKIDIPKEQAQMITTLFKTLEDLGIDGKDFIKLYECNRQRNT